MIITWTTTLGKCWRLHTRLGCKQSTPKLQYVSIVVNNNPNIYRFENWKKKSSPKWTMQVCVFTIILAAKWGNVPSDIWNQRRLITTCAATQSDQSLRYSHEETLYHWLSEMRPVKILIRLRECVRWTESFLGGYVRRYTFFLTMRHIYNMIDLPQIKMSLETKIFSLLTRDDTAELIWHFWDMCAHQRLCEYKNHTNSKRQLHLSACNNMLWFCFCVYQKKSVQSNLC